MREAIVSKQEAEQRQLEALRRGEMRDEISSREGSNEVSDECRSGSPDLRSTGEANVNEPLMIAFEDSVASGTIAVPGSPIYSGPSP